MSAVTLGAILGDILIVTFIVMVIVNGYRLIKRTIMYYKTPSKNNKKRKK